MGVRFLNNYLCICSSRRGQRGGSLCVCCSSSRSALIIQHRGHGSRTHRELVHHVGVVSVEEIRLHRSLAFHFDLSTKMKIEQAHAGHANVCGLADLTAIGQRGALHSTRGVDGVAEETVPRHFHCENKVRLGYVCSALAQ